MENRPQRRRGTVPVRRGRTTRRRVRRPLLLTALAGALALTSTGAWLFSSALAGPASPAVPPELDILSANVEEAPPIDSTAVVDREVLFTIEVAGQPACGPSTGLLLYGFLIDRDKNPATGIRTPAFEDLGLDARIDARCDPATGQFVSPVGTVTTSIKPSGGGTVIEIHTTVAQLPSIDFHWFAYAENATTFTRLPHEPDHSAWATSEIADV